ncbi:glycosyl hydrolase family 28-related protein [Pseudomonas sp. RIT-PI-S]|uniref:M10 family metallopeptidase C-terminal domain-containing protein n=1 Tax=Pseudomonas sp. RIT-PI-S TaxID=3035295 RepID=UPI0021D9E30E|nr:glycosyl hydrolase family 28-related protein [Pseudomonas sp. RIT-PI-S]
MKDFNATDFGALGDGHSNDTQALQAAIDAAAAAGGGTVHLAAGTYIISATQGGAALLLKDNVILAGPGNDASTTTLKLADGAASTDALVRSVGDHTGARFLTLDGNSSHTTGETSGWVNGSSHDVTLDHVNVTQASGYGIDLRGNGGQVDVSGGFVRNNGSDGIIASGLVDSRITDVFFRDNHGNGLAVTGALTIQDITCWSNDGNGVLLRGGVDGVTATLIGADITTSGQNNLRLEGTRDAHLEYISLSSHLGGASMEAVDAHGTQLLSSYFSMNNASPEVILHDSTNTLIRGNEFYGTAGGPPTILETGRSDGTLVEANQMSARLTPPVFVGPNSAQLANVSVIYTHGTAGNDHINYDEGDATDRVIYGGDGDDVLLAANGQQVLIGGRGADELYGSYAFDAATTVLRYDTLEDSYRTATKGHADLVVNFDTHNDKFDFAQLGITGLGDGHNGTLALIYNAEAYITYLKSYDVDDQGRRFEVKLLGDYRGQLNASHFQTLIAGTEGADTLKGTTHGEETLIGGAGRDHLYGLGSDDRIDGGAGGDRLSGGNGADTFVFKALGDSVVTGTGSTSGRDLIIDFDINGSDRLDVSALGFTGLGDGSGTSLALAYDSAHDLTRLYSREHNAQGGHFEVALSGDQVAGLKLGGIDFAFPSGTSVVDSEIFQTNYLTGGAGADVLKGSNSVDVINGGAGNDQLDGSAGTDFLTGGLGADRLTGGSGSDTFTFTSLQDSFRTSTADHSDLITDFSHYWDTIDVRALGFIGLGDGNGDTLNLSYDAALDKTFLRNFTVDNQGRSFQVTFPGDQVAALSDSRFNVAFAHQDVTVDLLGHGDASVSHV